MTIEDLLKPRVRLHEKGYPGSSANFESGSILTLDKDGYYYGKNPNNKIQKGIVQQFDHLFTPLQWWEERRLPDLPKYLKETDLSTNNPACYMVSQYATDVHGQLIARTKDSCSGSLYVENAKAIPATEAEYYSYISTKKQ